jgi:large subunit ribosomal protein L32
MPVPKRKVSKSRRDQRSASKHIKPKAVATCKECQKPNMPHQVCEFCGFYKGRKVITTKMERALQRGQTKQALAAKKAARDQSKIAEEGSSSEDNR